jgi:transcriptional regulator with GAF, ATPase, and Fis domain
MNAITGTVVVDFYESRCDLLVLTESGEFTFLDREGLDGPDAGSYPFIRTLEGIEVQILLAREVIEAGDWFPDALDDRGELDPAVAEEMAGIITADGILPGRVAKAAAAGKAWADSEMETNRLALERARAVAEVVGFAGGNQSEAARHLGLDQSTVNKLVKKAAAAAARAANA